MTLLSSVPRSHGLVCPHTAAAPRSPPRAQPGAAESSSQTLLPPYEQAQQSFPPAYQRVAPLDANGLPVLLPAVPAAAWAGPNHARSENLQQLRHAAYSLDELANLYAPHSGPVAPAALHAAASRPAAPGRHEVRRSHPSMQQLEGGRLAEGSKLGRSFVRRHLFDLAIATVLAGIVGTALAVRFG